MFQLFRLHQWKEGKYRGDSKCLCKVKLPDAKVLVTFKSHAPLSAFRRWM